MSSNIASYSQYPAIRRTSRRPCFWRPSGMVGEVEGGIARQLEGVAERFRRSARPCRSAHRRRIRLLPHLVVDMDVDVLLVQAGQADQMEVAWFEHDESPRWESELSSQGRAKENRPGSAQRRFSRAFLNDHPGATTTAQRVGSRSRKSLSVSSRPCSGCRRRSQAATLLAVVLGQGLGDFHQVQRGSPGARRHGRRTAAARPRK